MAWGWGSCSVTLAKAGPSSWSPGQSTPAKWRQPRWPSSWPPSWPPRRAPGSRVGSMRYPAAGPLHKPRWANHASGLVQPLPLDGVRRGAPWLYDFYAGHDPNRASMLALAEPRTVNNILFHRFFPQVSWHLHQMGPLGPRMFVPPQTDPLAAQAHPLIFRMADLFSTAMALRLEEAGHSGVGRTVILDAYWPEGTRNTAWWKNDPTRPLLKCAGRVDASPHPPGTEKKSWPTRSTPSPTAARSATLWMSWGGRPAG